jgi:hypothetical protein
MDYDKMPTFDDAVRLVAERLKCSEGRAKKIVRDAYASSEVGNELRWNELPSLAWLQHAPGAEFRRFNLDDLLDWLGREHGVKQHVDKSRKPRASPQTDRAELKIKELYPNGVPLAVGTGQQGTPR